MVLEKRSGGQKPLAPYGKRGMHSIAPKTASANAAAGRNRQTRKVANAKVRIG